MWRTKERQFHRVKYWEIIADNLSVSALAFTQARAADTVSLLGAPSLNSDKVETSLGTSLH